MKDFQALTAPHMDRFNNVLHRIAEKTAADELSFGVEFPQLTSNDGSWRRMPASLSAGYSGDAWSHGNWFCGFWIGILLASYLHTGRQEFLTWAQARMRLIAPRAKDPNTHDIGFIFHSSAIPCFNITGDRQYADMAMQAADRLRGRVVNTQLGSYLSSWGPLDDPRARCSSAIDTMANLSLLYWATSHSGDGSYALVADSHAAMTACAFLRDDGSTYHAVEYDTLEGTRMRGYTFQGAHDESCWSRGQAWAIYGYVASARETGKAEYLDVAERLAEFYLRRLEGQLVPPWDFDATGPDASIKDTAAAAIVSAALLELGRIHPDGDAGKAWYSRGVDMLAALCTEDFAYEDEHRGLLKHSCYSKPHNDGVDSATMFGDYYFVEALCGVVMPARYQPRHRSALPEPR